MVVLWRKLVLLSVLFFVFANAFATHNYGHEITWEVVNKDTIKITQTYYTDCNSTLVGSVIFKISDGSHTKSYGSQTRFINDVTPVCKKTCNTCSSSSCSFKYGLEATGITVLVDLSYWRNRNSKTLTIWEDGYSRSSSLTNGGSGEGLTVKNTLVLDSQMPSTPKYRSPSPVLNCLNADIKFDLGGESDNSGYSYTYHLVNPLEIDTSTLLKYNNPYKYNRPVRFQGWPNENVALPGGFHLDSTNGLLQFRAKRIEQSVAAIEVRIWKNGKVVATTMRDFSIIIIKCANNDAPVISGTNCRTPSSQNFDFIACGGQSNCFSICVNDADTADSIALQRIGDTTFGNFQVYSHGNAIDSAKFCYTPTNADTGKELQLMLNVNDNVCPIPSNSNYVYRVKVVPYYDSKIRIKVNKLDSCGRYEFEALEVNNNPMQELRWYLNDTLEIGQGTKLKYNFNANGSHKISVNHIGCSNKTFDTTLAITGIVPISILEYSDTVLCANQTLDLGMNAKDGHGTLTLQWNIPNTINVVGGNKKSDQISLGFNKQSTVQNLAFSYTVTDSFGCKAEHKVNATVKNYEERNLEIDHSYCLDGDTILPLGLFNNETGWTGAGVKNDTFNSHLAPKQVLTLVYLNKQNANCIIDTAVIENYGVPTIQFIKSFTICKEGNDTLLSASPTGGTWTGAAINSNGTFTPSLAKVGANYLTYLGTDSNGCSSTDSLLINVEDYKPTLTVTDSAITCLNGDNLEITAQPNGGTWSTQGFSSTNNEISLDPSLFGVGSYEVVYSYQDSNQCSNADTAIAIINDLPKPAFDVDSVVFQKDTLELINQTIEVNSTNYTWIINGPQNKTETGFEPQIIMDSLGMHSITLIATDAKTGCTDTLASDDSVKVVLNTGLLLGQIEGLKVYPNPFSQELNFTNTTGQNLQYQIIAQDGKVVFDQNSSQATININLSYLVKGVYTLKTTGNGFVEVQQVVKE
ncbi:MAG: T9SS type A sorting domain-containing protein [Bacteroidia bacterium]